MRIMTMQSELLAGLLAGLLAVGTTACKDLAGTQEFPAGTPDPAVYHNLNGAIGMRNSAMIAVVGALQDYIIESGLLTDELESSSVGAGPGAISVAGGLSAAGSLDERILPELTSTGSPADGAYKGLQGVRTKVSQALGALAVYDTTTAAPIRRGELLALDGYAEILLADMFCSGVPLSTLDYNADYTYHAGLTTAQVYQDAIAKEDSALALAGTNDSVGNLARVLKARALLALGQASQAAQVVAAVPDSFRYQFIISTSWTDQNNICANHISNGCASGSGILADHEGGNGLPYLSSGDPRVGDTVIEYTIYNQPIGVPNRASASLTGGTFTITVADGIEARLIEAEAALVTAPSSPAWLAMLNHLRVTATVPGMTQPFAATDTLVDPGSRAGLDSARLALLFKERAYWLYLSGHRQGDLRRLIRQYNQDGFRQEIVYPTGPYLAPGSGSYGTDVTAPISAAELVNPLFHGCKDRNA